MTDYTTHDLTDLRLPLSQLTRRARNLLYEAAHEAARQGHSYIGVEHILLALTAQHEGVASQILRTLQVNTRIREELLAVMAQPAYRSPVSPVIASDGSILAYEVIDETTGRTRLIDTQGRPIVLRQGPDGQLIPEPQSPTDDSPAL